MMSFNGVVAQDRWQHIALTWDRGSGVATLFRDATVVAQSQLGNFTPQTAAPFDLFLGWRPNSAYYYNGLMDEPSFYRRALTTNELLFIYHARASGKCKPVEPPTILSQPEHLSVPAGAAAFFQVQAEGTAPLAFQWKLNGADLTGATDSSLLIPAVRSANAGDYTVVLTNVAGAVTSQVARLAVLVERTLRADSPADQVAGGEVSVPVGLTSTGDIGAMTFTLRYDPDYLAAPEVSWDPALHAAARQVNVPRLGEIRAVFALPGTAVPAGVQPLAVFHFRARTLPEDAGSELLPVLIDASRPTGEAVPYGTDILAGRVRVLAGGGLGDNNGNGRRDVGDVTLLLRLLAQLDTTRLWDVTRNDLNLNGVLDSGDAVKMLRLAAGIDGLFAGAAAAPDQPLPDPSGLAIVAPARLTGSLGQLVTVQVRMENSVAPVDGVWFELRYPPEALRLLNAQSLRAGPIVPLGAVTAWSIAPAQTNFTLQTGRLIFAASSPTPWPTNEGVVAEMIFQVQSGATNLPAWPLYLESFELTPDGYEIVAPARVGSVFIGRDLRSAFLQVSSRFPRLTVPFDFWLSGEPGVIYQVEVSSDLTAWLGFTNVEARSSPVKISDINPDRSHQRFYRAKPLE
jgi:hypothetical protein